MKLSTATTMCERWPTMNPLELDPAELVSGVVLDYPAWDEGQ